MFCLDVPFFYLAHKVQVVMPYKLRVLACWDFQWEISDLWKQTNKSVAVESKKIVCVNQRASLSLRTPCIHACNRNVWCQKWKLGCRGDCAGKSPSSTLAVLFYSLLDFEFPPSGADVNVADDIHQPSCVVENTKEKKRLFKYAQTCADCLQWKLYRKRTRGVKLAWWVFFFKKNKIVARVTGICLTHAHCDGGKETNCCSG